jgi:hypothetical protein
MASSDSDPRLNVARYRVERLSAETRDAENPSASQGDGPGHPDDATQHGSDAGQPTMEQRAQFVEISLQQAMRRGDFDDLPGAGKPLRDLGGVHDPDWWIRAKIEREKITGLGPPALTLRSEDAELDARLDQVFAEERVREIIGDFNRRVIEARRQLLGGPPVVTAPRDPEVEVARWRERDEARREQRRQAQAREDAELAAMTPRQRRRAKRGR